MRIIFSLLLMAVSVKAVAATLNCTAEKYFSTTYGNVRSGNTNVPIDVYLQIKSGQIESGRIVRSEFGDGVPVYPVRTSSGILLAGKSLIHDEIFHVADNGKFIFRIVVEGQAIPLEEYTGHCEVSASIQDKLGVTK